MRFWIQILFRTATYKTKLKEGYFIPLYIYLVFFILVFGYTQFCVQRVDVSIYVINCLTIFIAPLLYYVSIFCSSLTIINQLIIKENNKKLGDGEITKINLL